MSKKAKTAKKAKPATRASVLSPAKMAYMKSVALSGAGIRCTDPDLDKLSVDELNVLHLCKHEIIAAIHRLYIHMDIDTADPFLRKYMEDAINESKPRKS
jgi:hypothetical protein